LQISNFFDSPSQKNHALRAMKIPLPETAQMSALEATMRFVLFLFLPNLELSGIFHLHRIEASGPCGGALTNFLVSLP
jgi:hypothetical protein